MVTSVRLVLFPIDCTAAPNEKGYTYKNFILDDVSTRKYLVPENCNKMDLTDARKSGEYSSISSPRVCNAQ